MRILGMMVMMMFFAVGAASAVTVNLTNGNAVQGDIVKRDSKSLQISVDGVAMTYYADEIKDVDGKPFVAPAPVAKPEAVAQPAAVVQPQTVAQPEAVAPAPAVPAPAFVAGTIDPDKKVLILKFIDVFGTRQALTANFGMMLKQIEKEKPDEAQKIRQRVKVDEIIERLLPIYDRNFTSEDLKAFIAFYGSAEGQKLIGTIPELMKESVQESVKYMKEKFPEVKQGQ
jgi:hypothetical protein